MGNPLEDIDDIFKQHIDNMREMPDTDIWENIALHLNNEANKKYKRKFIYWRGAAAIIAICLFVALLLLTIRPSIHQVKNDYVQRALTGPSSGKQMPSDKNAPLSQINNSKKSETAIMAPSVNPYWAQPESKILNKNKIRSYANQQKNPLVQKSAVIPFSAHLLRSVGIHRTINNTPLPAEDSFYTQNYHTAYSVAPVLFANVYQLNDEKNKYIFNASTIAPSIPVSSMLISKLTRQHFSIALVAAPYFMNYLHNTSGGVSQPGQGNQQGNQGENNELSYSIGVLAQYRVKHWQISTGLQYTQSFVTIQPKTIYASQNSNGLVQYKYTTSTGYAYVSPSFSVQPQIGDSLYTTTAKHTLQYISVPLRLGYQLNKNKWSITPTVGIALNVLKNATIETSFENGSQSEQEVITSLQGLKKMYFSVFAGTSFQYAFSTGTSLFITPNFQMGMQSITNSKLPSTIPYQLGIEAGINISF
ncbi:MAG: hypothetical protein GTN67_00890 [Hydrotalea flava]|uniref:hypothetical protein n=1 Tax=Hydrotalea lipotrueae TaxID=2803817 RepID=UPI0009466CEE|nr:hypothetical protein [Hydrotalea lipotrueae]MBY0348599.1 autotransporter outer membrane beta-barrel domain-containing protein [Hydrotalea flava]NIM34057.1 hypothetical protein [Hydrotalea flava]NIM36881.1 hypothetical protein [Hydrotalea flava]NIN02072.1 hypothetical protein [Hydrotalea flava]NIN13725.1 hypothetical protein [Hydrotalea flava]